MAMTKDERRYRELIAQRNKLDQEIATVRAAARREALKVCVELIGEFEFTTVELGLVKAQQLPPVKAKKADKTFAVKTPARVNPPKYIDPATGKTWSGRGHQPGWIVGNRDDYLIRDASDKPAAMKRATQNNKQDLH